jgi:hypothetical protein
MALGARQCYDRLLLLNGIGPYDRAAKAFAVIELKYYRLAGVTMPKFRSIFTKDFTSHADKFVKAVSARLRDDKTKTLWAGFLGRLKKDGKVTETKDTKIIITHCTENRYVTYDVNARTWVTLDPVTKQPRVQLLDVFVQPKLRDGSPAFGTGSWYDVFILESLQSPLLVPLLQMKAHFLTNVELPIMAISHVEELKMDPVAVGRRLEGWGAHIQHLLDNDNDGGDSIRHLVEHGWDARATAGDTGDLLLKPAKKGVGEINEDLETELQSDLEGLGRAEDDDEEEEEQEEPEDEEEAERLASTGARAAAAQKRDDTAAADYVARAAVGAAAADADAEMAGEEGEGGAGWTDELELQMRREMSRAMLEATLGVIKKHKALLMVGGDKKKTLGRPDMEAGLSHAELFALRVGTTNNRYGENMFGVMGRVRASMVNTKVRWELVQSRVQGSWVDTFVPTLTLGSLPQKLYAWISAVSNKRYRNYKTQAVWAEQRIAFVEAEKVTKWKEDRLKAAKQKVLDGVTKALTAALEDGGFRAALTACKKVKDVQKVKADAPTIPVLREFLKFNDPTFDGGKREKRHNPRDMGKPELMYLALKVADPVGAAGLGAEVVLDDGTLLATSHCMCGACKKTREAAEEEPDDDGDGDDDASMPEPAAATTEAAAVEDAAAAAAAAARREAEKDKVEVEIAAIARQLHNRNVRSLQQARRRGWVGQGKAAKAGSVLSLLDVMPARKPTLLAALQLVLQQWDSQLPPEPEPLPHLPLQPLAPLSPPPPLPRADESGDASGSGGPGNGGLAAAAAAAAAAASASAASAAASVAAYVAGAPVVPLTGASGGPAESVVVVVGPG